MYENANISAGSAASFLCMETDLGVIAVEIVAQVGAFRYLLALNLVGCTSFEGVCTKVPEPCHYTDEHK